MFFFHFQSSSSVGMLLFGERLIVSDSHHTRSHAASLPICVVVNTLWTRAASQRQCLKKQMSSPEIARTLFLHLAERDGRCGRCKWVQCDLWLHYDNAINQLCPADDSTYWLTKSYTNAAAEQTRIMTFGKNIITLLFCSLTSLRLNFYYP